MFITSISFFVVEPYCVQTVMECLTFVNKFWFVFLFIICCCFFLDKKYKKQYVDKIITKTVKFYHQDAVYGLKANPRNAEIYQYNDRADKDVITSSLSYSTANLTLTTDRVPPLGSGRDPIMDYFLKEHILGDNEDVSVLYPTINGVEQKLTLFDNDYDTTTRRTVKDLNIRIRSHISRMVKEKEPDRINPCGLVGIELFRINHETYGKNNGGILELRNVNYELKYKDDILIVPSVKFRHSF